MTIDEIREKLSKAQLTLDDGTKILLVPALYTSNGTLGLIAYNNSRVLGQLTLDIKGEYLRPGEIHVKTWGDNETWVPQLLRSGLFRDTKRRVAVGQHEAHVWSLN